MHYKMWLKGDGKIYFVKLETGPHNDIRISTFVLSKESWYILRRPQNYKTPPILFDNGNHKGLESVVKAKERIFIEEERKKKKQRKKNPRRTCEGWY